jgi:uncharacterized protein YjbI with pentapeptide repeats
MNEEHWGKDQTEVSSDFRGADLSNEVFSNTVLPQRDFRRATLRNAEFVNCDLQGANFADADLSGANFRGAKLQDVDFSHANLAHVNFYRANLTGAVFVGANLFSTNYRETTMGQTIFANLDMETCVGLDSVTHEAPSSVGVECLYRSANNLPVMFLQGVGFPKIFLTYLLELIQAGAPIQFHSCFISYCHLDDAFSRRLWISLRNERIRVWYAPEDLKGGQVLLPQIDRAIQLQDKLLVVLSKSSLASNWVQTEIRRARRQEQKTRARELFPIRLCSMETLKAWECFDADTGKDIAEEIREYFIPDFSDWTEPGVFEREFEKLRRDLKRVGVLMRAQENDPARANADAVVRTREETRHFGHH